MRSIVEEAEAETQLTALAEQFPRFEEFWDAWTWRLSRDPFRDAIVYPGSNPPYYLLKTPDLSVYQLPAGLTMLYRVTNEAVYLDSVKLLQ